jgi:hypothetical protein
LFGPAAPTPVADWPARLRYWLPPAAAAALALAFVGVVIAAIVRGHRPTADSVVAPKLSDARARVLLGERLAAVRTALDEGSYRLARAELAGAHHLALRYPPLLEPEQAARLARWRRQADLLADLLPESVGEIVRHSAGRADKEWEAIFRERYAGRSIVLDARVFRDAAGHVHVDYHLEAAGGVGDWDLDALRVLEGLPLRQPQRLFFGFRVHGVRRLARDHWTVVPEPDSGVLLTDPEMLIGLSVAADEELVEVLRRQARWASDG